MFAGSNVVATGRGGLVLLPVLARDLAARLGRMASLGVMLRSPRAGSRAEYFRRQRSVLT